MLKIIELNNVTGISVTGSPVNVVITNLKSKHGPLHRTVNRRTAFRLSKSSKLENSVRSGSESGGSQKKKSFEFSFATNE